jgi:hypothetical protein
LATILAQIKKTFLQSGGWSGQHSACGCDYYYFSADVGDQLRATMDATRVRDNLQVVLKVIYPAEGPHELMINKLFSSPELAKIPDNHCAPLLGVIEIQRPEPQKLMVFPFLRPFNKPKIQTFGEFIAFFTQICQV